MSPNPTDLLQHICLHLFGHMSDSVLKVSSFCDVREVLEVYSETVDWAYFKESSLRYGVWHQMQQTLYLCQQHWDVSMPEHFLSELTQEQREWANERFFLYLRQGHMDEPAKLNHALNAGMERLRNTNGTTAKIRHLKDYLFPKRAYLLQRYGANGWSLLLLRILHPAFLIRKILNALFKSLSAKVLRIRV